jgi:hypothetical protein
MLQDYVDLENMWVLGAIGVAVLVAYLVLDMFVSRTRDGALTLVGSACAV